MANKKLIIPKQIVSVDDKNIILSDHAVEIEGSKISSIISTEKINLNDYDGEVFNYPELTLIPGFVQTHVHLCQTLFRGLADDLFLLDWLQKKIFPFENAHNENSLSASAKLGINELLLGGTTTILDMGTLRYQEVVFEELIKSGMRAFSGKCLIDENELFPRFKSNTKTEIEESYKLAKKYHVVNQNKIFYGFAPRFVLSCSKQLLIEIKEMMKDFPGSLYHTHASENKTEVEEIKKIFNKGNVDYFDSIGVLDDHTVLAHCIHLNETEKLILKERQTRVAHCSSANLKLGSGIAPVPTYLENGIPVSLGADGAPCNNNMSIFIEMRHAAIIQKPFHGPEVMDALTVFRLATIEGAKALHLDNEIGSIEVGKKADLVLLNLNSYNNTVSEDEKNIYSDIVYSANANNVISVMVDGRWLVKENESVLYDQKKIIAEGKTELKSLLSRA
ncbi:MAG: amidohydrolase family protein [Ignavibacteriaceae bacterium]|nr:amidohydrolase family protein [Ignavibacteriaceae bacterium]